MESVQSYLTAGDDRALAMLPAGKVFSRSHTSSTGCAGVTAFHGFVLLVIVTHATCPRSLGDEPLGKATVYAPLLSLGTIGRPYAALSMLC